MAIQVQEVTLRIIYDDAEIQAPRDWAWQNSMTVGHANVGHAYQIAEVRTKAAEPASSAEAVEFVTR